VRQGERKSPLQGSKSGWRSFCLGEERSAGRHRRGGFEGWGLGARSVESSAEVHGEGGREGWWCERGDGIGQALEVEDVFFGELFVGGARG